MKLGFNTQPPEGGCGIESAVTHSKLSGFNTQPPEGGCQSFGRSQFIDNCFNTQPPEGGCYSLETYISNRHQFQHTAARRRLRCTHSDLCITNLCFNTQPPEGGCTPNFPTLKSYFWFQHTAARRRLQYILILHKYFVYVSTHSRPKAAAFSSFV